MGHHNIGAITTRALKSLPSGRNMATEGHMGNKAELGNMMEE